MEQLHVHNQKTYEKICYMYNEGMQRVAVVQPTGSGKSFLMEKLIEDNSNSRFFVLSTSHKINNQFKEMLDEETLKRIDFNIYCNLPNMNQEVMEALQPDYILLDEMHRALAKEWNKGIINLLGMYKNAKVLGLSATPIRYLDKCRNVVEELFDNNLACNMSLSEAVLDGILPMARYVCGVYSYEKDTDSINKKIEKSLNSDEEKKELLKQVKALKENLDKGKGVSDIFRKYIVSGNEKFVVFLKDTTHLKKMKPVIEKWFIDAGFSVRMYEVHSKNIDKDKEFQEFKEDTAEGIKLCLSVNMIAEGIHGDIDGVIMLRETISPNLYFQMIGRAFACGKKTIPLIFDLVANSQFISDVNISFPNELREEIERRKKESGKRNKDYEVEFNNVDEFMVMDQFMDVVSGFREIEGKLVCKGWTEEEIEILKKYYSTEGKKVESRLNGKTIVAIQSMVSRLGIKKIDTWTDEEIEILKKYYPKYSYNITELIPNKSKEAIESKAGRLRLFLEKRGIFTDEEDELIKEYYPKEGNSVYKRLDNKTKVQCSQRAKYLGISSSLSSTYTAWTDEEDKILRDKYPTIGNKVAIILNKKTKAACIARANRLGIRKKQKNKYKYVYKINILFGLILTEKEYILALLMMKMKREKLPWKKQENMARQFNF